VWSAVRAGTGEIEVFAPYSAGCSHVSRGTDADAEALACELLAMLPPERRAAVARELAAAEGLRVLTAGQAEVAQMGLALVALRVGGESPQVSSAMKALQGDPEAADGAGR
jgi:hypothetical protein